VENKTQAKELCIMATTSKGESDLPPPEKEPTRGVATRWGGDRRILVEGFVAVPTSFLTGFSCIRPYGLSIAEALFVLELMVFKWDAKNPYPSYGTIAERMGVSTAYARKLARSLETKGYLRRTVREGQTNQFNLQPLFERFAEAAEQKAKSRKSRKKATPG
jgi:hypothetical protein